MGKLKIVGWLAVLSFTTLGSAQCVASASRTAEVDAEGIRMVRVVSKAGDLVVRGSPDVTSVIVDGRACATNERMLDRVRVDVAREGDVLIVTAIVPDGGPFQRSSLELDLMAPSSVMVDVRDGSGDILIETVAETQVEDGSGEMSLTGIAGSVVIEDDGSGGIRIRDVAGDVWIASDGSGDIDIRTVGGSVSIDEDGSGSITVTEVSGDFILGEDGSGNVSHTGVSGTVRIPQD